MIGLYLVHGGWLREMWKTFLHTAASQTPSWLVSYFDCFISAFAFSTSNGYGS